MPREAYLEGKFLRGIRSIGGRTWKIHSITKGVPDRLVLLPGGRVVLVELKTDSGKLSPSQVLWHQRAAELGTEVVVLSGSAEVDEWIERNRT